LEADDAHVVRECSGDGARKNPGNHQRGLVDKIISERSVLLSEQDLSTDMERSTSGSSSTRRASSAVAHSFYADHHSHSQDREVTSEYMAVSMHDGQGPIASAQAVPEQLECPEGEDPHHETESAAEAHAGELCTALQAGMREQVIVRSCSAGSLGLPADIQTIRPELDAMIEMQDKSQQLQEPAQHIQCGHGITERHCFICLQDGDGDNPLVSCCSTCYGYTHVTCWHEWRTNQQMTALRSRLLGPYMQTNNLLQCTICKSGTAVVPGEEDGLEWMNELLYSSDSGVDNSLARMHPNSSPYHPEDLLLAGLSDSRDRTVLTAHTLIMVSIMVMACTFMAVQRFYEGDTIVCCIIALYELCVLLIFVLAVVRRRSALMQASRPGVVTGDV